MQQPDYRPQPITVELIRRLDKAAPPEKPREIRDRASGLILRHQSSGYLGLYANLGRGKRERLCDARRIIDPRSTWTLGKAKAEARRLKVQHSDGRDFAAERKAERAVPTLERYLEDTYGPWLKQNRRSGEGTLARLEACFVDRFGDKKLAQITPATLEEWRTARQRDGVAAETIKRDVGALRAALTRAVKLEIIASNPLRGVETPEVDRHKRVVRALTSAEKAALLTALEVRDDKKRAQRVSGNRWRQQRGRELLPPIGHYADVLTPAVIVSLETGLRRGELFSLDWSRVDLDEKTLRVEGKTAKTFETREIPLNETAQKTLRNWWLQCGQPKAELVFTLDGGKLGNLKHSYHAVLEAAGIKRENRRGERVNWHSLRHTFGTLLGAAGVDPTTLMKLMG
ncbi:MAG TPA: tyrosine-type recombinase/integrase, partial [Gammaproteobacteria bacterium]|nr:tyrosine-type recombinase/integrase [Gammaproteobacteria bacterium]